MTTTLTLLSATTGSVKATEAGQLPAINPVTTTPPPTRATFQMSVSGPTPVFAQANISGTVDGMVWVPVTTLLVSPNSFDGGGRAVSPATATQDVVLGNNRFAMFSASVGGLSPGASATVTMSF
jgi:hypothetical protein